MSEPAFAVSFTAAMLATELCEAGDALVFNTSIGLWQVATSSVRSSLGKRAEAVAMTDYGGALVGKVQYQMAGILSAELSGLGTGIESWVRVASDGSLERCTPGGSDDLVGKCATDGRVHLDFGVWDSTNISGGGGSSFTAGGDLSGSSTSQTVQKVRGAQVGTAAGSLTTGQSLQVTAGSAADWGPVNLALSAAVTGVLPVLNGGTALTTSDLSGQANKAVTVNAGATGFGFTAIPAGASTPTGTGFTTNTGGVQDAASKPYPLAVSLGGTHQSSLGTSLQVLRVNSGGTDTEWATLSGGTTPGGSTTQFQWNSSGSFAGSSGLTYDSTNNRPRAANGLAFTAGGFDMVLSGTPTAARVITFPDATDTVLLRDAVQTPSNKTMSLSANTITDASATTGDIVRHNGTRFVRLARGSANQVLQTNAGATDIAWATVATGSPGGSTTDIQYNNAGAFGGITNITTDGVNAMNFLSTSSYIQWLASGATTGFIRLKSGASRDVIVVDDGGGGNRAATVNVNTTTASNNFGFTAFNTTLNGASTDLQSGGSSYINLSSSLVQIGKPRVGNSTPYSSEGFVSMSAGGTLTSAQYSRTFIQFNLTALGGITATFPLPASNDASYMKCISVIGTASAVTLSDGAHTTAAPAINTTAQTFFFTPSGIWQVG
jgi:hypothetical protein